MSPGLTYLSVDGKARVPRVRWNDLDNPVLASLWSDLSDVLHRLAKLVFARSVDWRIGNAEESGLLGGLPCGRHGNGGKAGAKWMASPLDRCQVEWFGPTRAEGNGMVVARRWPIQCTRG